MPAPSKRTVRRQSATPKPSEDDEDEAPTRSRKASAPKPSETLRGGWSAAQDVMDSTSTFAQTLKPEEKAVVIKFLEDDPYVNYRRHWIERSGPTGKIVRSYSCLKSFNKECPLCEAGDRAQAVAAFNVALIGDDGHASIKSWDCGPKIYNILKTYANDPKIAPLTRGFFLVSRSGKKGSVNHNITPVKASALEEDYDIPVPDKEELDRLERYTADVVEVPTRKSLDEIALEIADEYA
jgi:hypothetical protein